MSARRCIPNGSSAVSTPGTGGTGTPPLIERGPVLDLGAGAGRAALYLQDRGIEVTAVDSSPGAVEVCRLRGVRDVCLADLSDAPDDRRWGAVLLLCGNLGLGGSWDGNRELLSRLAQHRPRARS